MDGTNSMPRAVEVTILPEGFRPVEWVVSPIFSHKANQQEGFASALMVHTNGKVVVDTYQPDNGVQSVFGEISFIADR